MSRIENMKGKNDKTQDREEQMQRGLWEVAWAFVGLVWTVSGWGPYTFFLVAKPWNIYVTTHVYECASMWDKLFTARFSGHPTLLGMVRMPEKSWTTPGKNTLRKSETKRRHGLTNRRRCCWAILSSCSLAFWSWWRWLPWGPYEVYPEDWCSCLCLIYINLHVSCSFVSGA